MQISIAVLQRSLCPRHTGDNVPLAGRGGDSFRYSRSLLRIKIDFAKSGLKALNSFNEIVHRTAYLTETISVMIPQLDSPIVVNQVFFKGSSDRPGHK